MLECIEFLPQKIQIDNLSAFLFTAEKALQTVNMYILDWIRKVIVVIHVIVHSTITSVAFILKKLDSILISY